MGIYKSLSFCLSCFFLLSSCFSREIKENDRFPVMNIEEGLKNFRIEKLSDYASDIRYVKLETHDSCLIGPTIEKVFLEDNRLFIWDDTPVLKVFNAESGRFLYNVGRKGNGAEELPNIRGLDLNPKEKKILLNGWANSHLFDLEGNFQGKITRPELTETNGDEITGVVTIMEENIFASGVFNVDNDHTYAAVVFNDQAEIIYTLKSYRDMIQYPTIKVYSDLTQGGKFYRSTDQVYYHRKVSDSIYIYNDQTKHLEPYLRYNFGKHESTYHWYVGDENPDLIELRNFSINDRFLFTDFSTRNASPEPYEDEVYRGGTWNKYINKQIYGIYDKEAAQGYFLLQPVKGIKGLKNDLDGGIPFWPETISSNHEMIDYHQAYKFLEYAERIPEPDDSFKEMIKDLQEEDNPVIVIAKGKYK